MAEFKQVIVLRSDLDMSKGKSIAQACHASLKAYEKAEENDRKKWKDSGAPKIVLQSENLEQLEQEAFKEGLNPELIRDAGKTELEPGTVTALGIGPAESEKLDRVTGELELVS